MSIMLEVRMCLFCLRISLDPSLPQRREETAKQGARAPSAGKGGGPESGSPTPRKRRGSRARASGAPASEEGWGEGVSASRGDPVSRLHVSSSEGDFCLAWPQQHQDSPAPCGLEDSVCALQLFH